MPQIFRQEQIKEITINFYKQVYSDWAVNYKFYCVINLLNLIFNIFFFIQVGTILNFYILVGCVPSICDFASRKGTKF